jgi:hypothetical protein
MERSSAAVVSKNDGARRLEAAMKELLPSLTGILLCMLCTLAWHVAGADTTPPLSTEPGQELRAAVTDMPDIIDMSHADPRTWHNLPTALPGAHIRQEIAENHRDRGNG